MENMRVRESVGITQEVGAQRLRFLSLSLTCFLQTHTRVHAGMLKHTHERTSTLKIQNFPPMVCCHHCKLLNWHSLNQSINQSTNPFIVPLHHILPRL